MDDKTNIFSKKIELEISIKLFEYLKRKSVINEDMYNFCINKLTHKLENNKIIDNYKVLT